MSYPSEVVITTIIKMLLFHQQHGNLYKRLYKNLLKNTHNNAIAEKDQVAIVSKWECH